MIIEYSGAIYKNLVVCLNFYNSLLSFLTVLGRLEDVSSLDFYAVQKNHEYRKEWDKLVIDIKVIERNEAKNEEVWQWISSFPVSLIKLHFHIIA